MSTVQIKNVSIGQESLVYGKSSVVEKFTKKVSFEFRVKE